MLLTNVPKFVILPETYIYKRTFMESEQYSITRTFSIKIKLWKRFKERLHKERLTVSATLTRLIEKWLSGEINLDV